MSKIFDALSSVTGRLTTGAAMAVAIVVGLYPDHPRPIDPVRIGTVITTILAWLLAELASGRKISAHDVGLFGKIVDAIPAATVDFLRNHNFKAAFHPDRQGGLHEIAEWAGSRFEFVDGALQRRWKKVHRLVREMSQALIEGIAPAGNTTLLSAAPAESATEEKIVNRVQRLNKKSVELSKSLDTFESYARARLKL